MYQVSEVADTEVVAVAAKAAIINARVWKPIDVIGPACCDLNGPTRRVNEIQAVWRVAVPVGLVSPEGVRVWLSASIRVSRVVPKWVVDYAARRALPRATAWLGPAAVEKQKALEVGL